MGKGNRNKGQRQPPPQSPIDWRQHPFIIVLTLAVAIIQPAIQAQGIAVNLTLSAFLWLLIWGAVAYVALKSAMPWPWKAALMIGVGALLVSAWLFIRGPVPPPVFLTGYMLGPVEEGSPFTVVVGSKVVGASAWTQNDYLVDLLPRSASGRALTAADWSQRAWARFEALQLERNCWPDCARSTPIGDWNFEVASDYLITPRLIERYFGERDVLFAAGVIRYGKGKQDVWEYCLLFRPDRPGVTLCDRHNGPRVRP